MKLLLLGLSIVLLSSCQPIRVDDTPSVPAEATMEAATPATMPSPTPFVAATPDISTIPPIPAPAGLGDISLPADWDEVTALLEAMPNEVAGYSRTQDQIQEPFGAVVSYGVRQWENGSETPLVSMQVRDLTLGDFFPNNWLGAHVVAEMSTSGSQEVTAYGQDGKLIWASMITSMSFAAPVGEDEPIEEFPVYTFILGEVDNPWLFSFSADSQESLDGLLGAWVEAAKQSE